MSRRPQGDRFVIYGLLGAGERGMVGAAGVSGAHVMYGKGRLKQLCSR